MAEKECKHDWKKINTDLMETVDTGEGVATHHCNKCGVLGKIE